MRIGVELFHIIEGETGGLVPLLQGVHPRMASERAGPNSAAVLEPPGLFALNYGTATPLVAVSAHVVYGAVLGLFLGSH